jgi:hypothetical protein
MEQPESQPAEPPDLETGPQPLVTVEPDGPAETVLLWAGPEKEGPRETGQDAAPQDAVPPDAVPPDAVPQEVVPQDAVVTSESVLSAQAASAQAASAQTASAQTASAPSIDSDEVDGNIFWKRYYEYQRAGRLDGKMRAQSPLKEAIDQQNWVEAWQTMHALLSRS